MQTQGACHWFQLLPPLGSKHVFFRCFSSFSKMHLMRPYSIYQQFMTIESRHRLHTPLYTSKILYETSSYATLRPKRQQKRR